MVPRQALSGAGLSRLPTSGGTADLASDAGLRGVVGGWALGLPHPRASARWPAELTGNICYGSCCYSPHFQMRRLRLRGDGVPHCVKSREGWCMRSLSFCLYGGPTGVCVPPPAPTPVQPGLCPQPGSGPCGLGPACRCVWSTGCAWWARHVQGSLADRCTQPFWVVPSWPGSTQCPGAEWPASSREGGGETEAGLSEALEGSAELRSLPFV